MKQDLQDIEDAILMMEDSADIWQNGIIKVMLRALYHLLVWAIKKEVNHD